MKILIVGVWQWPQYEEAFATGLQEHGVQVEKFALNAFFKGKFARYQQTIPISVPIM